MMHSEVWLGMLVGVSIVDLVWLMRVALLVALLWRSGIVEAVLWRVALWAIWWVLRGEEERLFFVHGFHVLGLDYTVVFVDPYST